MEPQIHGGLVQMTFPDFNWHDFQVPAVSFRVVFSQIGSFSQVVAFELPPPR